MNSISRQRIFSTSPTRWVPEVPKDNHPTIDDLDRLEGVSSSASLDRRAQTLTFEHYGSISTAQQKAMSPLVIPLGAIAAVECRPGRSTHWFWVVRRGDQPWRKGVHSDPCGVVSGVDPSVFAERVRAAAMHAAPVYGDDSTESDAPSNTPGGWRGIFAKGLGRAVVEGFFNTR